MCALVDCTRIERAFGFLLWFFVASRRRKSVRKRVVHMDFRRVQCLLYVVDRSQCDAKSENEANPSRMNPCSLVQAAGETQTHTLYTVVPAHRSTTSSSALARTCDDLCYLSRSKERKEAYTRELHHHRSDSPANDPWAGMWSIIHKLRKYCLLRRVQDNCRESGLSCF